MSSSLLGPFQPNIRPFAAVRLTAVALYHSMQILWSVIACQNALQISQKKTRRVPFADVGPSEQDGNGPTSASPDGEKSIKVALVK